MLFFVCKGHLRDDPAKLSNEIALIIFSKNTLSESVLIITDSLLALEPHLRFLGTAVSCLEEDPEKDIHD